MEFLAELAQQYAALLISVCALFLTISQAVTTRKHNRLTVRPHLTTFTETKPDEPYGKMMSVNVKLSNNGLGPAIIKKFEPLLDGNPIVADKPGDILPVVKTVIPVQLFDGLCQFAMLRKGYVIGKGDVISLATLVYSPTIHDDPKEVEKALQRFHIRITFESGYEEEFVYDSRSHRL